jgi:ABC-type uncharacterized transport system auxiliary subunit
MYHFKKAHILFLGILLLPTACVNLKQPSNKIEYYTLEYDSPKLAGLAQLPYAIRIEPFIAAPTYNTTQIIYREQSFERDAYAYHKWRINPGSLVTQLLSRDLRNSGLFKAVISHESRLKPLFALEGKVEEFFELDGSEQWNAVLSLTITLAEEDKKDIDDRLIFQKSYRTMEACERRNPRALAAAMSQAMERLSGELIKDIHTSLLKYNP